MENDLYSKIVRERGSLEKLGAKLPGFRGYVEMSARRQADRMMRDHVATQLRQQLNRLVNIEKMLLDGGGLSYMSKTRSAKTKFQTFIDRIASDTAGYSGFFDAVKIDENDLAVIYSFDAGAAGLRHQVQRGAGCAEERGGEQRRRRRQRSARWMR